MSREVSEALRRVVAARAYHVCEYCLVHDEDVYHGWEIDHVLGVKHGGLTVVENLAYACFHCNRHKGTDLGSISRRSGTLVASTTLGQIVGRNTSAGSKRGLNR